MITKQIEELAVRILRRESVDDAARLGYCLALKVLQHIIDSEPDAKQKAKPPVDVESVWKSRDAAIERAEKAERELEEHRSKR